MSAVKLQTNSSGIDPPSLRLIKQKVRRAGQNDSSKHLDSDLERSEPRMKGDERHETLSPQPPSFPRGDDSRTPARPHEMMHQNSVPGKGVPDVHHSNHSPHHHRKHSASNALVENPASHTPGTATTKSSRAEVPQTSPIKEGSGSSLRVSQHQHQSDHTRTVQAYDDPPIDMTLHEVGLDNLGNTCFMNSVLQCLLHVEPLVQFFLRPNLEHHLNLASPKKGALAMSFRQLVIDVYKKRTGASVSPASIQKAVCAHAPYLMDFQQQDSQEFLRFLLDGMSEDLCRKHSEGEQGGVDGNGSVSVSASGIGVSNSASVGGGASGGRAGGILPMLPSPSLSLTSPTNNNNTSSAPDFSRTLPTHLSHTTLSLSDTGNNTMFSMSMSAQNSPMGNPLRHAAGVSSTQRLRDQTQMMRTDDSDNNNTHNNREHNTHSTQDLRVSMHKHLALGHSINTNTNAGESGDDSIPRPRNNNHEDEATSSNTITTSSTTNTTNHHATPSKYVSRLRKFSAASPDQQEPQLSVFSPEKHAPLTPSSAQIPTTPHTTHSTHSVHTTTEQSRVNALLRSADEGEDFSPDDQLRLSVSSPHHTPNTNTNTTHTNNNNNNLEESTEFAEDVVGRRIRKNKPARRLSKNSDDLHAHTTLTVTTTTATTNANSADEAVAQFLALYPSLHSLPHTLLQRIVHTQQEARVAWGKYLKLNDSVITDLFAGQLQSTIECMTCHHRSSSYDPFLDLSVPIIRDSDLHTTSSSAKSTFMNTLRSGVSSISGGGSSSGDNKSTLEKCLEKFTAEETLEGENMYTCEKCKAKRKSVKQLSIYKYPTMLVIHIKRFKYSSTRREKLSTDVHFPLTGLDLTPYVSADLLPLLQGSNGSGGSGVSNNNTASNNTTTSTNITPTTHTTTATTSTTTATATTSTPRRPVYDLIGVSNHHGSLHSGHYIAHVDTTGGRADRARRWVCFNDSRVSVANSTNIAGPTAYVLFYKLQG